MFGKFSKDTIILDLEIGKKRKRRTRKTLNRQTNLYILTLIRTQ